jgi:hypothetical protein
VHPEFHDEQAQAFADWYEREPTGNWDAAFEHWGGEEGKDFNPIDLYAIKTKAQNELIARAILSPDLDHETDEDAA